MYGVSWTWRKSKAKKGSTGRGIGSTGRRPGVKGHISRVNWSNLLLTKIVQWWAGGGLVECSPSSQGQLVDPTSFVWARPGARSTTITGSTSRPLASLAGSTGRPLGRYIYSHGVNWSTGSSHVRVNWPTTPHPYQVNWSTPLLPYPRSTGPGAPAAGGSTGSPYSFTYTRSTGPAVYTKQGQLAHTLRLLYPGQLAHLPVFLPNTK